MDKYHRYQLTFPIESNKIYKSKSLKHVAQKCYKEFKAFSDIGEGMFSITNLDKDIEYRFRVKDNVMENIATHKGGNKELQNKIKAVAELDGDENPYKNDVENKTNEELKKAIGELKNQVSSLNQNVKSNADKINDFDKQFTDSSEKLETISKSLSEHSEQEQNVLQEILANVKKLQNTNNDNITMDDNVYNNKLSELYALQRLNYIERNHQQNDCVIF